MEKSIKQLKEERALLIEKARDIFDRAKSEDREPTAEENREFDKLMHEADKLRLKCNEIELNESEGRKTKLEMADNGNDGVRVLKPGEAHFLTKEQRMVDLPASPKEKEFKNLDLGKLVQLATGNTPIGDFSLERRALQEGSDVGGGFSVPVTVSREIWDMARNQSSAMKCGITILPMPSETVRVPKLTSGPSGEWKLELVVGTEDSSTEFGAFQLVAKTLFFYLVVSNELLMDSVNLGEFMKTVIAKEAALKLDYGLLLGSGSNEPLGLYNDSGVTQTSMVASAYWDDVADLLGKLEAQNFTGDAVLMSSRSMSVLRKLKDGNGQYMGQPTWCPQVFVSNQIPDTLSTNKSAIFAGEWRNMILGVRTQFRLEVLKEIEAKRYATAFLGAMRCDAACIDANAFQITKDVSADWT